ncbi:MAG: hypothetical protein HDT29_00215 [Clostridiales bacterium]|nr:hypothetical protein [Clostridiales bacterium]
MASKQLLILGNGFDLQCGLRSSYEDFFNSEIIDDISKNFHLQKMKPGCVGFWETLLFYYYKQIGNSKYDWCDIETIIKDTLWIIYYGDKNKLNNHNKSLWHDVIICAKTKEIPERYACYIINGNEEQIKYLFCYCVKFILKLDKRDDYTDDEKLHMLTKHLQDELNNFEKRFCKYIKNKTINPQDKKGLNRNYVINAVNLLALLTKFTDFTFGYLEEFVNSKVELDAYNRPVMKNILSNEFLTLKDTNIINFNYTALFDILRVESPCAYSNVHGKLCNISCVGDCNSSNIIFGIDDTLIKAVDVDSNLHIFSKTYRKMRDDSAPITILPPRDDNNIEIIFYGHSLSKADYSYFQSIFDYYNIYSNDKVCLIFYYSKGHEQYEAIYKLINEYGLTLANENQGKNLIHKLLLENRLKIEEKSL